MVPQVLFEDLVGRARIDIVGPGQHPALHAFFRHQVIDRGNGLLVRRRARIEDVLRALLAFILDRIEEQPVQLLEHRQHGLPRYRGYRYPLGVGRWEFPQGTAPTSTISTPASSPPANCARRRGCALVHGGAGQLDVAPGMSSQRGWVFLATGITEGEHDREHEEQDMHSAWFSRAQVEAMIRGGDITDAQSVAAWGLLLLSER